MVVVQETANLPFPVEFTKAVIGSTSGGWVEYADSIMGIEACACTAYKSAMQFANLTNLRAGIGVKV